VRAYVYICTYIFPYIPFVLQPERLCHGPFRFIVNSIYPAVAYRSLVEYRCALKRAPTPRRDSIRCGCIWSVAKAQRAWRRKRADDESARCTSRGINSQRSASSLITSFLISFYGWSGSASRRIAPLGRACPSKWQKEIETRNGARIRSATRLLLIPVTSTSVGRLSR